MPTYRIQGADRSTGSDRTVEIEATDEASAQQQANATHNLLITNIKQLKCDRPKPSCDDLLATIERSGVPVDRTEPAETPLHKVWAQKKWYIGAQISQCCFFLGILASLFYAAYEGPSARLVFGVGMLGVIGCAFAIVVIELLIDIARSLASKQP